MSSRSVFFASIPVVVVGFIVWKNLQPYHHPGFWDMNNPFAEPWSPDPRTRFGWPVELVYCFDFPSRRNGGILVDHFGLLINLVLWAGLLAISCVPFLLSWRRLRNRR